MRKVHGRIFLESGGGGSFSLYWTEILPLMGCFTCVDLRFNRGSWPVAFFHDVVGGVVFDVYLECKSRIVVVIMRCIHIVFRYTDIQHTYTCKYRHLFELILVLAFILV